MKYLLDTLVPADEQRTGSSDFVSTAERTPERHLRRVAAYPK